MQIQKLRRSIPSYGSIALSLSALAMFGIASAAEPTSSTVLMGSQEVPPVTTAASARSAISIAADRTVTGVVVTTGIDGTAAHIHSGAIGTNGPPLITLVKTSDNHWSVPAGAVLTQAQYDSYKLGGLYVNVHSAMHPSGEIRLQLQP